MQLESENGKNHGIFPRKIWLNGNFVRVSLLTTRGESPLNKENRPGFMEFTI